MEENRFVQLVAGMLYRTDRDSVTPETRYKGLKEWNFLFEVSLAMMLEEEYHVEVTPEDFRVREPWTNCSGGCVLPVWSIRIRKTMRRSHGL